MTTFVSKTALLPTSGIRLHYWQVGDPKAKTTVVLLHGFLDIAASWHPIFPQKLPPGTQFFCIDMRGHGLSDRVGRGGYYYFPDYIADLKDWMSVMDLGSMALVGHSMGGSIAAYYAGTYPHSVSKLALLEGLGPKGNHRLAPETMKTWIEGMRKQSRKKPTTYKTLQDAANRLQRYDTKLDHTAALRLATHATKPVAGGVQFCHDLLHLTQGPLEYRVEWAQQFWRAITCPVLFIDGKESELYTKDMATERKSHFTNAATKKTVTISNAGHMLHRHQPQLVWEHLAAFIAE